MAEFFVATKRVIKFNTGNTNQFAPRTVNRTSWHLAGPFSKRATAERTACSAMGTHTCLDALVLTPSEMDRLRKGTDDYELRNLLAKAGDLVTKQPI